MQHKKIENLNAVNLINHLKTISDLNIKIADQTPNKLEDDLTIIFQGLSNDIITFIELFRNVESLNVGSIYENLSDEQLDNISKLFPENLFKEDKDEDYDLIAKAKNIAEIIQENLDELYYYGYMRQQNEKNEFVNISKDFVYLKIRNFYQVLLFIKKKNNLDVKDRQNKHNEAIKRSEEKIINEEIILKLKTLCTSYHKHLSDQKNNHFFKAEETNNKISIVSKLQDILKNEQNNPLLEVINSFAIELNKKPDQNKPETHALILQQSRDKAGVEFIKQVYIILKLVFSFAFRTPAFLNTLEIPSTHGEFFTGQVNNILDKKISLKK